MTYALAGLPEFSQYHCSQQLKMEALIAAPANCEVLSVIRFLNSQSIVVVEIYHQLSQVYGPNVMSKQMVYHWCRQFTAGRQHVHDEECSRRPSVIMDNLVWECIMENRLLHNYGTQQSFSTDFLLLVAQNCHGAPVHKIVCQSN